MSYLQPAVLRQIVFTHRVREFLRDILKRLVPLGVWHLNFIRSSNDDFDRKLDAAFRYIDERTATAADYRQMVVDVLCSEISRICNLVHEACAGHGWKEYADRFVNKEKFVALLMQCDEAKLDRLRTVLDDKTKSNIRMLREIGAVLEDADPDSLEYLSPSDRDRATARLDAIAGSIESGFMQTTQKLIECHRETMFAVQSGTQAIADKIDALETSPKGKGHARYSDGAIEICMDCWRTASADTSLRETLNTRLTYDAVFKRHKARLEAAGVTSAKQLRDVLRAQRARGSRAAEKEKSPKPKKPFSRKPAKNGIMHTMGKAHKTLPLAMMLAVAGALASPLRSAASPDIFFGGGQFIGKLRHSAFLRPLARFCAMSLAA